MLFLYNITSTTVKVKSKKKQKQNKLSFACTQFLSRKVKATEVLENRNVILTINKAGGGRGVRLKLLF